MMQVEVFVDSSLKENIFRLCFDQMLKLGAKIILLKAMHALCCVDTCDLKVGSGVELDCFSSASLIAIHLLHWLIVAKLLAGLYTENPYTSTTMNPYTSTTMNP